MINRVTLKCSTCGAYTITRTALGHSSYSGNPRHPRTATRVVGQQESRSFPIKARFVVQYEQGMRPEMLDLLEVPKHYTKGSAVLKIEAGGDKNRWEREIPLTEAARKALDSVCPKKGLIFGTHDYRDALRKAAKGILDEEKAKRITPEDLRHSRLTEWAETGNLELTRFRGRLRTCAQWGRPVFPFVVHG